MINALFAADQFGGIGFNGTLPWPHNPNDLKNFKRLTDGHIVVMGRRSWDDPKLPKPLKGRIAYVATNRPVDYAIHINGDLVAEVKKLEQLYPNKTIWVVGGAEILEQCRDLYDRIYVSHFKGNFRTDTKVNLKSILAGYRFIEATADPKDNFTAIVYESLFRRS